MTDLHALKERLEKATGPDRELDADMCRMIDPSAWARYRIWAGMPCGAPEEVLERDAARWVDKFTSSIDAITALIEREMPGAQIGFDPIFFEEDRRVEWDAIICIPHWDRWSPVSTDWIERIEARHSNRVIAADLAFISALIARQALEAHHEG